MPVVTVGRLITEQTKLNSNGEERWIRGTVNLYGACQLFLRDIKQRKLPFTIVTGKVLPREPAILLGEITTYPIPNSKIEWKTLEIKKFIPRDSVLFEELGCTFPEAVKKIANKDPEFLKQIGAAELATRKKIVDLVGSKNRFADHLMEQFGDAAYQKLVENPWKMIHIIPYFTIKQADAVAEKLGIPLTDKRRFVEYFRYLLDQSFESHRNTYISENEFLAFYWMHFSEEMSMNEFKSLANKPGSPVIRTKLGYHPAHFYFAEEASYEIIMKSLHTEIPITDEEEKITELVLQESEIKLTSEQIHAVKHAFHSPLHIITGGPGTGKTTVLNTILKKLALLVGTGFDDQCPFLLIAPTGKAAYRMFEQTGIVAHTIHSAFGIIPEYGCLDIEQTAKRLSHVRYLIIDESSMLDTKLFGDLCRVLLEMNHIPFILMVGDADQLPPVQHGQVFQDLLQFLQKHMPEHVTSLTLLKRQENGSHIPELASYIKQGQFPNEAWFADKDDIFFVPVTMDTFSDCLMKGVLLPKKDSLDTIQILTPYRNGTTPDTIYAINTLVEPLYNPVEESVDENHPEPTVTAGNPPRTFRIGDKVINRQNRSKTIINGSIGTIIDINDRPRDLFAWTIEVQFESGEIDIYRYEEFKFLEIGYAITIHASQGSEYENVVTCALRNSTNMDFLNKNLLYVAITRASKRLVLMGQISTFQQIAATNQRPRHTALAYWLENRKGEDEWEG